jgi:hypothetical protein
MKNLAILVIVLAVADPAFAAPPMVHSDSGSSERAWSSSSKPGMTEVAFVFRRERPAATTRYVAYGECERSDQAGTSRGEHRLVFKNVRLTGVDSGVTAALPKLADDLRDGVHDFVLWDLTPVMDRFAEDSAVLVSGKILVKKRIAAQDILACDLGLVELDSGMVAREDAEARFGAFRALAAAGRVGGPRRE